MKSSRTRRWLIQIILLVAIVVAIVVAMLIYFWRYPILTEAPERPEQALVPVRFFYPKFNDDMDFSSLEEAVRRNLEYLERLKPDHVFYY
ncbi:MAG: hypothetical protein V1758_13330, partial [Pseudomonadota bacterium]